MKPKILTIVFLIFATSSCDKVKNLVGKARSAVVSELGKQGEASSSAPDPALQKLVDQTAEGVIFRKDLPFPGNLEVKTTRTEEVSGRVFEKSELGSQMGVLQGTLTTISKLERKGDSVAYSLLESTFLEPVVEGKKPAVKQLSPPSKPAVFVKSGSAWKAASMDFHTANLAQTLAPVFDQLLVENALAPRTFWFGKKRVMIGEELSVSANSLPMIVSGNAKGKMKLKLEAVEAVNGHPCGVFSVTGNFSRSQFPGFDGSLTNEDVAIESGKFWLSLLYPVILKENSEIIQTIRKGGNGGLSMHGGGKSKISLIREWKIAGK